MFTLEFGVPGGEMTEISPFGEAMGSERIVACLLPKLTAEMFESRRPSIVTMVPPLAGPPPGVLEVRLGRPG
jgi:hypothetical protein